MLNLNDITTQIILFEDGELNEEETISLFQALIDEGVINQLQGSYGRIAEALIEEGLCHN